MQEIWKEIEGFPEYYISSYGRIYSTKSSKLLKPNRQKARGLERYCKVILYKKGEKNYKYVHRLVLETFEPCENMKNLTVNHKDEDKTNNRLDNLEWLSYKENTQYSQGTYIEKIDMQNNVVKVYFSLRDLELQEHVGHKTILKRCESGELYKNFYWRKVDNPRKI